MFGIGTPEAGVIVLFLLLIFAPTLVAFFVGYMMGQRKSPPERSPESPEVAAERSTTQTRQIDTAEGDDAPDE